MLLVMSQAIHSRYTQQLERAEGHSAELLKLPEVTDLQVTYQQIGFLWLPQYEHHITRHQVTADPQESKKEHLLPNDPFLSPTLL